MAGHGGGAWKVAYADFVTAMMAFFLVMWIVAQSKQVKQAVAEYFRDPSGTASATGGASGGGGRSKQTIAVDGPGNGLLTPSPALPEGDVGKKGGGHKPSLIALHDGDQRMLGGVVLFDEDSAELTAAGEKTLRSAVSLLRGKRHKIELRAHATHRPLPPDSPHQDAWQLCYARCLAVKQGLEKLGIESDRMRLSQAGEHEPRTIRPDAEQQKQNARVEIYMLPEMVDDLVGTREERAERRKAP